MLARIFLEASLVLWICIGRPKAYSNYNRFLNEDASTNIVHLENSFNAMTPFSASGMSDESRRAIQACMDQYIDAVADTKFNTEENKIESYLKKYMECALTTFDQSRQPLCKQRPKSQCKTIDSFNKEFKTHPQLSKYSYGIVFREMEVKKDRLRTRPQPKEEVEHGCRDKISSTVSGKFSKEIATRHTTSLQLDKSNKVSFGNGLDVDVSWSAGIGIFSIGQSYSGKYMVTDSDSTATSDTTTTSLMETVSMDLEWDELPGSVYTSSVYKQNELGNQKFIAWMEVQGWLGRFEELKDIKYNRVMSTTLTLLPIGDFALYSDHLGAKRINSHSFKFPYTGYINNNLTSYLFTLTESDKCNK